MAACLSELCLCVLQAVSRSLKMLDLIYPYETHKLGVIYVGPGQVRLEALANIPTYLAPVI